MASDVTIATQIDRTNIFLHQYLKKLLNDVSFQTDIMKQELALKKILMFILDKCYEFYDVNLMTFTYNSRRRYLYLHIYTNFARLIFEWERLFRDDVEISIHRFLNYVL